MAILYSNVKGNTISNLFLEFENDRSNVIKGNFQKYSKLIMGDFKVVSTNCKHSFTILICLILKYSAQY